ncbi:hypothetical protein VPNG_09087 [Cytospora leucostoma]|uniref:Uncharacterized protein n=1 Tax=Cytospora leucostoma TaxID=1230097 RepID=A0A423VP97_9PEZI|nr:hypothetical protein VPNG_09087 [Cytospora leucostoma]
MMVSSFHDGRSQAIPMAAHASPYDYDQQQQHMHRKRKADTQDTNNERLSKRLSLLNLEQKGARLYVPVEQTQLPSPIPESSASTTTISANNAPLLNAAATTATTAGGDELMHLDDTSHKVYIYNLDDELSSESEPDDPEGKLVFLPDVEKHLRANRIVPGIGVPKPITPNKDGELAGMQLVLYDEGPSSLTVPVEQDSVRKAIIEARARVRQRQQEEREAREVANNPLLRDRVTTTFATPVRVTPSAVPVSVPEQRMGEASYMAPAPVVSVSDGGDDDAMDID